MRRECGYQYVVLPPVMCTWPEGCEVLPGMRTPGTVRGPARCPVAEPRRSRRSIIPGGPTLSMRTPGSGVVRGRWGRSLVAGGLSKSSSADGVAVLVCYARSPAVSAGMVARPWTAPARRDRLLANTARGTGTGFDVGTRFRRVPLSSATCGVGCYRIRLHIAARACGRVSAG